MPNSYSVPFNLFLQKHKTKDGREYTSFLPASDVRRILNDTFGETETEKIICGERSVITSCGSGMTAGVLWLGLQLLGAPHISLYDEVKPFLVRLLIVQCLCASWTVMDRLCNAAYEQNREGLIYALHVYTSMLLLLCSIPTSE